MHRWASRGLLVLLTLVLFVSVASALSARAPASRALLEEEELTLSNEVRTACAHLKDEVEFEELKEAIERYAIALFIFLLLITFAFAYMCHMTHFTYLHEAGAALLMGILAGWIISAVDTCSSHILKEVIRFDKEIFFLLLLPPIIFEAGYNMKRLHFFTNIGAIIMYAFVGTAISTVVIATLVYMVGKADWGFHYTTLESLIFGALISATDPVTVLAIFQDMKADLNLYSMVFGESVLNDAVAIVLYKTLDTFNPVKCAPDCDITLGSILGAIGFFLKVFLGSIAVGAFCGCFSAKLYKHWKLSHEDLEHLESAMTACFPYVAWMVAEGLGLSGIISILSCGVCMAHYTYNNMSTRSQVFTKKFYKMVAMLAETFVFIYMGMAMFSIEQKFQFSGILMSILIVLFSRTFNIFPLSALVNTARKPGHKIDLRFQFVMWFSGLRGAIAFALALEANSGYAETGAGPMMLTTTLFVVLFTVLAIGGTCATLLEALKVKQPPGNKQAEETAAANPRVNKAGNKFLHLDRLYLKPFFTHRKPGMPHTSPKHGAPGHFEMSSGMQTLPPVAEGSGLLANAAAQGLDADLDQI